MIGRCGAVAAVLLGVLALAACGSSGSGEEAAGSTAGPWTFTDGSGKTVELDERPTRIIAHAYSAAALMEFGITPVGVYADAPIGEDVGLRHADVADVTILGEEWARSTSRRPPR